MSTLLLSFPMVLRRQAIGYAAGDGREADCVQADEETDSNQKSLHDREPRTAATLLAGRSVRRGRREEGQGGVLLLGHGGGDGTGEKRKRARVSSASHGSPARAADWSPEEYIYPETM